MSKTIKIPKGLMVSVNDESGIAVGTQIGIQNVSKINCVLKESAIEPDKSYTDFHLLTGWEYPDNKTEVASGSDEIWAYSNLGTIVLSIELL